MNEDESYKDAKDTGAAMRAAADAEDASERDAAEPDPEVVVEALAAFERNLGRTKQSRDDWITTAQGLMWARQDCLRRACTNDLDDFRYRELYGRWLKSHGFTQERLPRQRRSYLIQWYENKEQIDAWIATQPDSEKFQYFLPESVWKRYKKSLDPGREKPKEKPPSRLELEARMKGLEEELRILADEKESRDIAIAELTKKLNNAERKLAQPAERPEPVAQPREAGLNGDATQPSAQADAPVKRGRGRPKGSKNRPKDAA